MTNPIARLAARFSIAPLLQLSFFYSCMNGVSAFAPFVLVTVLTRYLSTEEYGVWMLFISLASFLGPLLGLTMQDAVRMRYFEMSDRRLSQLLVTATWVVTAVSAVGLTVVVSFSTTLSLLTKFPAPWLWSTVVVAWLEGLIYTALAVLQFRDHRRSYMIVQIFVSLSTIVFATGFVLFGLDWRGAVLGKITSFVLTLFLAVRILSLEYSLKPIRGVERRLVKELLDFGVRYLPTGLSATIIPLTDRLFVAHLAGLSAVSFFGIGQMFAFTLLLVSKGFLYAWQPKLFRALRSGERQGLRSVVRESLLFYLCLPIVTVAMIGVSLVAVKIVVGPEFQEATTFVIWLFGAVLMESLFQHNQAYLHGMQRVTLMSLWSLIVIVSNVLLNYKLTIEYGAIGTAWATVLAFTIGVVASGCSAVIHTRRGVRVDE